MKNYFYDEITKTISCHTYYDFIVTLAELSDKEIDVHRSTSCKKFSICYKDGTIEEYYSWIPLYQVLPTVFGLDINPQTSFCSNSTHYLKFNSEPKFPTEVEEVVVESVLPTEEVSEEVTPMLEVNVPVDETQDSLFDRESAEELYNDEDKNGSKEALRVHAEEVYSVVIKKNKNFAGMVDELEVIVLGE